MSNDKDVTSTLSLLKILAVILANLYGLSPKSGPSTGLLNLCNHPIHARAHIVRILTSGATNDQR